MSVGLLLQGCLIGLAVAAPVGPNGVLCIRRTLVSGRRAGLASGLGATTVHTLYATLAASGLALVGEPSGAALGMQALGGGFLCYLAWRICRTPAADRAGTPRSEGLAGIYASTVLLTLGNPLTILSFSALIAGSGLSMGAPAMAPLVLGVAVGSAGWWCALSTGTSLLRARVTPPRLRWVNRVSGAAILAFGLLTLARALVV
jgi:threonine/homoserine/homoserine lactone efflux protein